MKNRGRNGKIHSIKWVIMMIIDIIVIAIGISYGVLCIVQSRKLNEISVENYEDAMESGYEREIKSQVEACITVLQSYYDQYKAGVYTEEEAKNLAKETIRAMRYREDDSGYMWIDDTDYNLVMHPILPEQEGTNRYELEDKNGVMIIQEIMKVCESGGGYNNFWFTKADGVTVAEKLAYSEKFEPWSWVVTTGNYMDDMQAEMSEKETELNHSFNNMVVMIVIVSIVILVISGIVAVEFGKRISKPICGLENVLGKIADGDLSFDVNEKLLKRRDEIGSIANQVLVVKNSLVDMVGGIGLVANQLQADNQSFSNNFTKAADNIKNISTAIEEIAEGATNQATETEVVSGKVKELERVIDQEREAVVRLEQAIASMMEYSGGAVKNVEHLTEISDRTNHAISFVNEQTRKTNLSVGDIQQAIGVITEIAEQTSLLSLNASIEAARAGEQGRGFAVVAEEIRKLADESNASASEIENAVRQLITNSESSVDKMQDVFQNVQEQMNRLKETKDAFENLYKEIQSVEGVSADLGLQTERLDELKAIVADSVSNLASIVEESAASAQETSASMSILNANIEENEVNLKGLVNLNEDLTGKIGKFTV